MPIPACSLTLKPSRILCGFILFCHGLALAGLWLSALPLIAQLPASVVLLVMALWRIWCYWQAPPRTLAWGDGVKSSGDKSNGVRSHSGVDSHGANSGINWWLDGKPARLLSDRSLYPHLLVLRFEWPKSPPADGSGAHSEIEKLTLVLPPDSLEADAHRRLRKQLLMA